MAKKVALLMGSTSDWDVLQETAKTLASFEIEYDVQALSAHRTPDALSQYLKEAENKGIEVFIAAAGAAAHLPGVVASKTIRPVLGVPIASTPLAGFDALLAIVQMPGGIPVGTLAVGKAGAKNAALLAIAIIANSNPKLAQKLQQFREEQAEKVIAQNQDLQEQIKQPSLL